MRRRKEEKERGEERRRRKEEETRGEEKAYRRISLAGIRIIWQYALGKDSKLVLA
jgi:hypothetical protein